MYYLELLCASEGKLVPAAFAVVSISFKDVVPPPLSGIKVGKRYVTRMTFLRP
jgi:hypothetical protein